MSACAKLTGTLLSREKKALKLYAVERDTTVTGHYRNIEREGIKWYDRSQKADEASFRAILIKAGRDGSRWPDLLRHMYEKK